jgi:hypothetical protein
MRHSRLDASRGGEAAAARTRPTRTSRATAALAQPRTRFTGKWRVAKLSKPEEQRVPQMTPLPAAFRAFVGTCGQG